MPRLYHAPGTRSVRVLWLCLEMDVSLDIETVPFDPDYLASPAWRAISPNGKIPLLQHGDLKLLESGAIMEYLLDLYDQDQLRPPPGSISRAKYYQWSWMSEATLIRPMGIAGLLRSSSDAESVPATVQAKIDDCLGPIESGLADSPYLLGDNFSACDIMMGYSLELLSRFRLLDSRYTKTTAYLARLKTRPACQKAIAT